MRTSAKTLHFPLAGLDRSRSYRVATTPSEERIYATPIAMNVRGTDVFSGRYRGGSRPGLKKVSISNAPEIYTKPTTIYRGRKIYAVGKLWYASRSGDITDFNVSGDGDDPSRPAMGKLGFASVNDAEDITAVFSIPNKTLFMATKRSTWAIEGDVTDGPLTRMAEYVGVISKDAWAYDGSVLYLVSSNGVYAYAQGQGFVKASDNVPNEIAAITEALCAYDPEHHALHIFTDKGDWYFDITSKAWWPQKYDTFYRPKARATTVVDGAHKLALLGNDGTWRVFDSDSTERVVSYVAIGPIRTSAREDMDGLLNELAATLAKDSSLVELTVHTGKTAEDSIDAANLGVVAWSYIVTGGNNYKMRPRVRGSWVTILMKSQGAWAFESMTAVTKALGGLR